MALSDEIIGLCRRAGDAILAVYRRTDLGVVTKRDQSPVTRADHAAHDIILPALHRLLPDVPVLSEEGHIPGYEERRRWRRYWLVDPLDGTREFIRRNDQFTVNIALVDDGRPVLGVVHLPVGDITYLGVQGWGAFRLDGDSGRQPISTRAMTDRGGSETPVSVMVSSRHGTGRAADLVKLMKAELGAVDTVRLGSSLKSCRVAEGKGDIYPRYGPTSEWDTAAAQAVVEAAGGVVVDSQMRPLRYNRRESLINPSFFVLGDPAFDWARYIGALDAS
jgi:3'(2'), 5'-bisphosphate nucleotidase